LRGPARLYVEWLRRRLRRSADERAWQPIDAIEVVTGGSIAHIYLDRGAPQRLTLDEIDARYPELIAALESCRAVGRSLSANDVRELVSLRSTEFWTRTLPKGLRGPARIYVDWLRRRVRRSADERAWGPIDAIEVVTGGSIAHIYFDRGAPERLTLDEIDARYPELIAALESCPAVGLMVARGADGPIVLYRGERHRLGDRRALERLEPFRRLGYELAATHLMHAAEGHRYGDIVLYGAFAAAGDIAFDFEFGSHGGIGPDELDQFVAHPSRIDWPLEGAVAAEEFYQFFQERYGAGESPEERDAA
jgi:hypothetical protein